MQVTVILLNNLQNVAADVHLSDQTILRWIKINLAPHSMCKLLQLCILIGTLGWREQGL